MVLFSKIIGGWFVATCAGGESQSVFFYQRSAQCACQKLSSVKLGECDRLPEFIKSIDKMFKFTL